MTRPKIVLSRTSLRKQIRQIKSSIRKRSPSLSRLALVPEARLIEKRMLTSISSRITGSRQFKRSNFKLMKTIRESPQKFTLMIKSNACKWLCLESKIRKPNSIGKSKMVLPLEEMISLVSSFFLRSSKNSEPFISSLKLYPRSSRHLKYLPASRTHMMNTKKPQRQSSLPVTSTWRQVPKRGCNFRIHTNFSTSERHPHHKSDQL